MSGRKDKLRRYAEMETFSNVYHNLDYKKPAITNYEHKTLPLKGNWNATVFNNYNSLVLELACGKADYTLGLAKLFPNKNFIGIDIKGDRIWRGAKTAIENNFQHVAFLRTKIELLPEHFAFGEVDEIWITFPDPFPKSENRRLTAPHFIEKYKLVCKSGSIINLKTDDPDLYEYSLAIVQQLQLPILLNSFDIDADGLRNNVLRIKTFYEHQHLAVGRKIKYLQFQLLF